MSRSVGATERRFFTNRLRSPQARTTKVVWVAFLLLILNLVYVSVDVWLTTGTQQVHDDFSRNDRLLEETRQLNQGGNSDERTAKGHRKRLSSPRLDGDMFKENKNESIKPDKLALNKSMRPGNRLRQDEIALHESRLPSDNVNSDRHDVEENIQPDHGLMLDEHVVDEKKEPADGRQSDEDTTSGTKQLAEVSTDDQRAALRKYMQGLLRKPSEEVMPTIFDVCQKACRAMTPLNISKELAFMNVERLDIDPKSVSLDDPPIPIIGTDQVHQRIVSGLDVAEFMAHVTMWRRVFHGTGGIGVFISCRVRDAVPLLKTLRNDKWFRNETEGGTMGNERWDILLLGAGRPGAIPGGSIEERAVSQNSIEDGDVFGYAVSQNGANQLLRYVRGFTVPTRVFMSVVLERGLKVMRWDGAGLGEVRGCTGSKGEEKDSAKLPFYPPVHWIHAAARDRQR